MREMSMIMSVLWVERRIRLYDQGLKVEVEKVRVEKMKINCLIVNSPRHTLLSLFHMFNNKNQSVSKSRIWFMHLYERLLRTIVGAVVATTVGICCVYGLFVSLFR